MFATRLARRALLALWAMVFSVGCSAIEGGAPGSTPEVEAQPIATLRQHTSLESLPDELLRLSELSLGYLGARATKVSILDRVPTREIVFLELENGWQAVLEDKNLVPNWSRHTVAALETHHPDPCLIDAEGIAQDLTKILVDPDPRYGIVIDRLENIPSDYSSSDVLRDLERAGLTPDEIGSLLLSGLSDDIQPPTKSCIGHVATVTFYTWHYFGGEIAQWTLQLADRHADIERTLVAKGVGSYDMYH